MESLPTAFDALRAYRQFIVYKLVNNKGKYDKFPIDHRTARINNAHDSTIWLDADSAILAANILGKEYGVGFVFTVNDPFFFLDIDSCLEPCGSKWSPLANELVAMFPNAAVEVSSSGKGLHIIGSAKTPPHACKNTQLKIELYTENRFVALTGYGAQGNAGLNFDSEINDLINTYFSVQIATPKGEWTNEPVPEWNGDIDDGALIERAIKSQGSKSIFGGVISFKDLWEANLEALAKAYPDRTDKNRTYDESSADAALAQRLAYWTGNNCERMRELMLKSNLVREKWNREKYLLDTILFACSKQKEWFINRPADISTTKTRAQPRVVEGATFLSIDDQLKLFDGCTYVCDTHQVLIPGGYLLNADRFRVMYGGYNFPLDGANQRVTRNAWEAFTESQLLRHRRVDSYTFRPDLPFGEVIERNGQQLVNTYWPIETPKIKGDPSLFLKHVELIMPEERDGVIMLSYLSAMLQHRGVKFQWCPLIQGVEGNGKTLFTRVMAFCIGERYAYLPESSQICDKYNDWMYGKLFYGVEDIFSMDGKRGEIAEKIKPMITNSRLEIHAKFSHKVIRDVCGNFILNSNHQDAIIKTQNDRRFAPFFTKQQQVQDLKRFGMDNEYFYRLYNWLHKEKGLEIINYYLANYQIHNEFNPATACQRAPVTSTTSQAVSQSLNRIEQETLERIEEGKIGFKGGYISSKYFNDMLIELHAQNKISHHKRLQILDNIDYIPHPHLKNGRVNDIILPDGIKSRLYIRRGHPDLEITSPASIAAAYTSAQNK